MQPKILLVFFSPWSPANQAGKESREMTAKLTINLKMDNSEKQDSRQQPHFSIFKGNPIPGRTREKSSRPQSEKLGRPPPHPLGAIDMLKSSEEEKSLNGTVPPPAKISRVGEGKKMRGEAISTALASFPKFPPIQPRQINCSSVAKSLRRSPKARMS